MDEAQINKRLDKIRLQVNTMKEIMDDVLQLARMQAKRIEFRPANSDLNALCQDIIDEFQGRPDYHERIIFRGLEKPIMLYVDLHLMRRIIGNLVSNALKYSPPDSAIHLTLSQDGESVRCQVTDHGIGIPADDLKHLFEPFHRAANVGDIAGTGLGLSIAREAVLTHGGSIEVESEVGQGTTFTVVRELPLPWYCPSHGKNHEPGLIRHNLSPKSHLEDAPPLCRSASFALRS